MEYHAHKRIAPDGEIQWQTLKEHLEGSADRAKSCLQSCNLSNAAYLAGLLHDLGKYTVRFQDYLRDGDAAKRGSVIHTFQGCKYLLDSFHDTEDDTEDFTKVLTAELLAFAIAGHHGLLDCINKDGLHGFFYRQTKEMPDYKDAVSAFLQEVAGASELEALFHLAWKEMNPLITKIQDTYPKDDECAFAFGLLARLLLSAVMEGDRYDTAAFMTASAPSPVIPPEVQNTIWTERLEYLENKLKAFPCDTPVCRARAAISEQCKAASNQPCGIFRLYVPTGGGKTLAALRFALHHAKIHQKQRLIFTSPLLSILEQNAKVIRDFIGADDLIGECHSNVVQTEATEEALDQRELLEQNWDAPILITTLVQFLNTLFDGKTTAIRRFHTLCNSVIVIDEAQTVPNKLLTLFNLAIRFLTEQCGSTVVLCTATQPSLHRADHPLPKIPPDLVPYQPEIWNAFDRTTIIPKGGCKLEEIPNILSEQMTEVPNLLVICNKRDEAARLFNAVQNLDCKRFHLSASMCMQHRRDTIAKIQQSLANQERFLCIATQVMEAGVDLSFARVLRFTAGMDSVVQAAGRCNRHGEIPGKCPVFILNCTDEVLRNLAEIEKGKTASIALIAAYQKDPEHFDHSLSSDKSIQYYYQKLYQEMDKGYQDDSIRKLKTTLFDLLSCNEKYEKYASEEQKQYCLFQAFQTAGKCFSVFDNNTTDVLVPYGQGAVYIRQLCSEQAQQDLAYQKAILKKANSYTISLYHYEKTALEQQGGVTSILNDSVLVLQPEFYDEKLGFTKTANENAFMEV